MSKSLQTGDVLIPLPKRNETLNRASRFSFEKHLTDCRCAVIITRLVKCLVTSEISLRKEILRQSPKGGAEEWH